MISIVIPARNEEENISELLESIENDDFEDYEVIVVDGDSSDRTVEVAKEYGAKVIEGPLEGISAARNKGWKAAEGDIIYFLDADSVLPKGTLAKIKNEFEEDNIDAINSKIDRIPSSAVGRAVNVENHVGTQEMYVGKLFNKVLKLLT